MHSMGLTVNFGLAHRRSNGLPVGHLAEGHNVYLVHRKGSHFSKSCSQVYNCTSSFPGLLHYSPSSHIVNYTASPIRVTQREETKAKRSYLLVHSLADQNGQGTRLKLGASSGSGGLKGPKHLGHLPLLSLVHQ